MKIEFTPSPKSRDIDFLTKKISEETPDFGECAPFGFFIHNDKKELIAGCNGSIVYGMIYTDQLWVHPDHRKKGLGKQLMEQVHAYGKEKGCTFTTVGTMSFQGARKFYECLGYTCDFERPGYAKNSSILCFKKPL